MRRLIATFTLFSVFSFALGFGSTTAASASQTSTVVMSAKCDNMMSWIRGAELALSYVIPNDRRPEAVKRMRDARGYVKEVRKLAKNSETKALANAYIRLDPRAGNLSKAQGLLADIEDNVNRGRC